MMYYKISSYNKRIKRKKNEINCLHVLECIRFSIDKIMNLAVILNTKLTFVNYKF